MTENSPLNELPIIEVPPELRGPSDEEILRNSEARLRKKKRPAFRPSKKVREARKASAPARPEQSAPQQKPWLEPRREPKRERSVDSIPLPKLSDFEKAGGDLTAPKSWEAKLPPKLAEAPKLEKPEIQVRSSITETPKPSSGRVLKGTFFTLGGKKPEATVVSAEKLEKERAAERAKKIQAKLRVARKLEAAAGTDSEPAKKRRGRPPKTSEDLA